MMSTNRTYKHWSQIFNTDSTLTSTILNCVLHHACPRISHGESSTLGLVDYVALDRSTCSSGSFPLKS
jgi:hypothetical protein